MVSLSVGLVEGLSGNVRLLTVERNASEEVALKYGALLPVPIGEHAPIVRAGRDDPARNLLGNRASA